MYIASSLLFFVLHVFVLLLRVLISHARNSQYVGRTSLPISLSYHHHYFFSQTFEVVEYYCHALKDAGYPEIRAAVCVGGEQNSSLIEVAQKRGIHCIVATPGRLNDHLNKKR